MTDNKVNENVTRVLGHVTSGATKPYNAAVLIRWHLAEENVDATADAIDTLKGDARVDVVFILSQLGATQWWNRELIARVIARVELLEAERTPTRIPRPRRRRTRR